MGRERPRGYLFPTTAQTCLQHVVHDARRVQSHAVQRRVEVRLLLGSHDLRQAARGYQKVQRWAAGAAGGAGGARRGAAGVSARPADDSRSRLLRLSRGRRRASWSRSRRAHLNLATLGACRWCCSWIKLKRVIKVARKQRRPVRDRVWVRSAPCWRRRRDRLCSCCCSRARASATAFASCICLVSPILPNSSRRQIIQVRYNLAIRQTDIEHALEGAFSSLRTRALRSIATCLSFMQRAAAAARILL